MSIYYTIKEHLHIENTENHCEAVAIMHTRLSLLGAAMLRDTAYIEKAVIVADGEEFAFDGKTVTEAFHKAMDAIACAETLDVNLWYGFHHYMWSESIDPGPFVMRDHLAKMDPQELDGLFYSMYNQADGAGDAPGAVVAYGQKGDTFYKGNVVLETTDTLPDGEWYAPETAVVYDPFEEETEGVDLDAVEKVCRQLCKFSSDDELDRDENGLTFALNNLVLKNDSEFREFAASVGQLIKLTNNTCSLITGFADLSGADPQTAMVDFAEDGSYTMECCVIG